MIKLALIFFSLISEETLWFLYVYRKAQNWLYSLNTSAFMLLS